jgi:hypothetical protein
MAAARRKTSVGKPKRASNAPAPRGKQIPLAAVEAAREALRAATPRVYSARRLVHDVFDEITAQRKRRTTWNDIWLIIGDQAEITARTLQLYYQDEQALRNKAAVAAASDRIATMLKAGRTWPQIHEEFPQLAPDATALRKLYRSVRAKAAKAAG